MIIIWKDRWFNMKGSMIIIEQLTFRCEAPRSEQLTLEKCCWDSNNKDQRTRIVKQSCLQSVFKAHYATLPLRKSRLAWSRSHFHSLPLAPSKSTSPQISSSSLSIQVSSFNAYKHILRLHIFQTLLPQLKDNALWQNQDRLLSQPSQHETHTRGCVLFILNSSKEDDLTSCTFHHWSPTWLLRTLSQA